ncbi:putative Fe(3+)-transporting ATPase (ABC-type transport system) [Thiomonas arsenitoxydans]|uniref:ABC transporter ATP-binding protein n=1 Tax=Thiomonas arsenitoxydans (strain DSM 22701 / CIP 110005 / 3As) TaxID=426114 RepID=D6CRK5_THIA3|nr:ABC transporter ATP-binding protein [Thiomonas arsenitoxydans]MBN8745870.1 ABC transporter ATP-binding protein [Thiomonas arsenitoxydans]CAZ87246.1 putative Fe(3+)-transporting ATPase (ABC-type transport system) [Thiomonas arsenitoxydans]CQR29087.1 putative Fe(3+)-transporting ATPase (ABC-type transport system) [Thiomonas arsenitoxydans]CQR30134.1 putative Fe(3+)-transporting ATPase (ABC-type transport system) [Thiomonas arsenitoxydans]CQR41208.1 putative Fe(3+)-transporting ATPase (ABC-typ
MSAIASDPAVQVHALTKRFGAVHAVRGVEFSVGKGEIFGLVGPDGAGKTTTMRMLAGVLHPDAGALLVDGVDVVQDPEAAKLRLSYMPQRFGLYEDLTIAENIYFYAELFGIPRKQRLQRSKELLDAAGLAGFERRLAGQLSGGMKQKLGLVCALIHTPRVLLLDEPTTGVDPVSRRDFWAILYNLRESGVAILMATAYMDEAERCSRLALFHEGEIRYCDTPARLKAAMPGALLAIVTAQPRALRDVLAGKPGVLGVLLMGDRVHVRVDDAAQRTPELQLLLATREFAEARIETADPGIEDVFVALLGGQGK